jgi:hypothetical protein
VQGRFVAVLVSSALPPNFVVQTTLLNVLAERTDIGVVLGDRFVNGQALPADFQAQT